MSKSKKYVALNINIDDINLEALDEYMYEHGYIDDGYILMSKQKNFNFKDNFKKDLIKKYDNYITYFDPDIHYKFTKFYKDKDLVDYPVITYKDNDICIFYMEEGINIDNYIKLKYKKYNFDDVLKYKKYNYNNIFYYKKNILKYKNDIKFYKFTKNIIKHNNVKEQSKRYTEKLNRILLNQNNYIDTYNTAKYYVYCNNNYYCLNIINVLCDYLFYVEDVFDKKILNEIKKCFIREFKNIY